MGRLYVVATPIGNLQEMSPRAIETLRNCHLIAAEDTRHTRKLLSHFQIKTPLISYHKYNEAQRSEEIVSRILEEGIDVALVSDAGTPCLSDPGYLLVRKARENGIPVYAVSGPSAITAALSISGLPATPFTFYGFPPRTASTLKTFLRSLKNLPIPTSVFYEAPQRVLRFMEAVLEEIPQAQVCVCSELTKLYERSYYGPVEKVIEKIREDPYLEKGEYVIILHSSEEKVPPGKEHPLSSLSLEALIVNMMVTHKVPLKEAIRRVAQQCQVPRREVYQASLNLKKLLEKEG